MITSSSPDVKGNEGYFRYTSGIIPVYFSNNPDRLDNYKLIILDFKMEGTKVVTTGKLLVKTCQKWSKPVTLVIINISYPILRGKGHLQYKHSSFTVKISTKTVASRSLLPFRHNLFHNNCPRNHIIESDPFSSQKLVLRPDILQKYVLH